jgi:uncharacterized protein YdiU (UPF0061 family)
MQKENPTLAKLPLTLAALIDEAVTAWADEFEGNLHISGADLVEWFGDWRQRMREAITNPPATPDLRAAMRAVEPHLAAYLEDAETGIADGVYEDHEWLKGLQADVAQFEQALAE